MQELGGQGVSLGHAESYVHKLTVLFVYHVVVTNELQALLSLRDGVLPIGNAVTDQTKTDSNEAILYKV